MNILKNDKLQHFGLALLVQGLFCLVMTWQRAISYTVLIGIVWELAQLDVLRTSEGWRAVWWTFLHDSLWDLACDFAGILLASGVVYVLKGIL